MGGRHLTEFMINDQTHSCSSTYQQKGRAGLVLDDHLGVDDLGTGVNKAQYKTLFCSGQTPFQDKSLRGSLGHSISEAKKGVFPKSVIASVHVCMCV